MPKRTTVKETFTYTEDQEKALEEILEWFKDKEAGDYKVLSGYAGTGKTTLLNGVVKKLKKKHSVIVTATTNKAVKVLRDRVNASTFSTIHSLLNIKPKREGTKEIFEPAFHKDSDIHIYDLVIIDECSMISKKLLGIIEEQKKTNQKILFCGDPAQLQPINEEKSECFSYEPSELVEIVRYGDAIAQKAKLVRDTQRFIPHQLLLSNETIELATSKTLKQFEDWRENPDRVRLLCWTNKKVEWWNRYLRKVDWGEKDMPTYQPGDIVIANSPCELGDAIIMLNSEEGKVIEVEEKSDAWECVVEKFSDEDRVPVRIVKDKYKETLKNRLNSLAQQARTDKSKWRDYWSLRKSYHDVRHAYAITTHKSQGSTFENVVMDIKDINKNRETQNRNQLVYVAMTRASDKVYIYEG